MNEKSILLLNDRATGIEKKLTAFIKSQQKLDDKILTTLERLTSRVDKLRKALPHVNFED